MKPTKDQLDRLLAVLQQAKVPLDAELLDDMLWLAAKLPGRAPEPVAPKPISEETPPSVSLPKEEKPGPRPPERLPERSKSSKGNRLPLTVAPAPSSTVQGVPIQIPTAPALPDALELARALRPLRFRVPSAGGGELDEALTVQRIVEEDVWIPVLRPLRERWLDLTLVVDDGPSMSLWRDTSAELERMLRWQGAFRSIEVARLATHERSLRLMKISGPTTSALDPKALIDPRGRRLVLVVTDTASSGWYDGTVAGLLRPWSQAGPIALVHMLPEALWTQTALASALQVQAIHTSSSPLVPDRIRLGPQFLLDEEMEARSVTLPVVTLEAAPLFAWSRFIARSSPSWPASFLLDTKPPGELASPPDRAQATPEQRVDSFWGAASQTARRLACLLSASPVLSLPVSRLVRHTMLVEAGQVHEAEVFLGGLLQIVTGDPRVDADAVIYDFFPGVRALLHDALPVGDMHQVLTRVSAYVENNLGRMRGFSALLSNPRDVNLPAGLESDVFAQIGAEVLLRMGGSFGDVARRLLRGAPEEYAPSPEPPKAADFFVPFLRNPNFVGREEDLVELHRLLMGGGSVGAQPAALTGMGGIGKTQLVVEYVYRYRDAHPGGIYWINAAESWQTEFAKLAVDVGLDAEEASSSERQRRLALAFAKEVGGRADALLVFDNVDDPLELRRPAHGFVAENLGCRLLFTTRRRDPTSPFATVEVQLLSEETALRLLLSGSMRKGLLEGLIEGTETELGAARAICVSLGYLPLALVLASAFLARHPRITLADYLTRIRKEGALAVADAANEDPRKLATRHNTALGATLRTQWDALGNDDLRLVLRAASLFGEISGIRRAPLGLLTGLRDRAEIGEASALSHALRILLDFSLVEQATEGTIRLHPLVREFAERQIEDRSGFAAECVRRLGEALWDMERLHEEVAGRGVDAVLEDLRVGKMISADADAARLDMLILPLAQEVHHLRGWDSVRAPGFFLQQLRNQCFDMGFGELRDRAEAEIERRGWSWMRERFATTRESKSLVRTVTEHENVTGVAVTGDERFAISASEDKTLKVWDLGEGKIVRSLEGHASSVNGVAVTADGRFAISASEDKTLKVWDLGTGQAVRTLEGHASSVNGVAVTADGRFVISASEDKTLKVWDLGEKQATQSLEGHTFSVNGVAVTGDGRFAISASDDKALKVWDLSTGQAVRSLEGHTSSVNSVAVTVDGRFAVSASKDKTLKVWDLSTGQVVRSLEGHASSVISVAITSGGYFVISASEDSALRVWNLATGRSVALLETYAGLRCCTVTLYGETILAGDGAGTLHILDWRSGGAQAGLLVRAFKGTLNRATINRLFEALISSFPTRGDLKHVVRHRLETDLDRISSNDNDLRTSVFELIEWAESRGRLGDLVAAALAENPHNELLRALVQEAS